MNLCIVGLGLIGGSVAAALRSLPRNSQDVPPWTITAAVRRTEAVEQALALDLVDSASTDLAEAVSDADIVLLCVPMLAMRAQLEQLAPLLPAGCIVTDAGSVKGCFIEDARAVFTDLAQVVPGHPIAGAEKSGMQAARADLFRQRRVLLTPLAETVDTACQAVRAMWEQTGAEVEVLDPQRHDRVLALTSHLPHALAFALVDTLATQQEAEEIFRYAAGGFRDFTRIAGSDPVMWRDICLTNRDALLEALASLDTHLKELAGAIDAGDAARIESIFRRARDARDRHVS